MEKHGAIEPGVTPPEHEDTRAVTTSKQAAARDSARNTVAQAAALDNDFRKNAAEATRKSL
jgi:hypothetical protein